MNIIATGYSEKHKKLVGLAAEQIRQEVEHRKGAFSLGRLFKELRIGNKVGLLSGFLEFENMFLQLLDRESFDDAVKQLEREGFMLRTGDKARVVSSKST